MNATAPRRRDRSSVAGHPRKYVAAKVAAAVTSPDTRYPLPHARPSRLLLPHPHTRDEVRAIMIGATGWRRGGATR